MREYTSPLRQAFVAGLRLYTDSLRDNDRLVRAQNLRPFEGGMRLQQVPEPIINGQYTQRWPFPQLFFNSVGFWLCSYNMVSQYDPTFSINSIVEVDQYYPWSIADFGKFAVGMNGKNKIWKDTSSPFYVKSYTNNDVPLGGCCGDFNRGQLFVGNPQSWYDCSTNFVAWSRIGEVSCVPDRRNTAGYMPMDWDGEVFVVKQLGQHMMVYGDGGISWLTLSSDGTWGNRNLDSYGVPYHTAVAGNKRRHWFVDVAGELWRLSANNELSRMGGKDFIAPMMREGQIVVTYHPRREECYVSGENYHYVRTRTGWGGPNEVPISGAAYFKPPHKTIGGIAVVPCRGGTVTLDTVTFVTDTISFSSDSQKTVEWVEVMLDTDATLIEACTYYRYGSSENWQQSSWRRANKEGVARVSVAGKDFRVAVRVSKSGLQRCEIDRMNVKWKPTDNRFTRGTTQATAQQGGLA